MKKILIYILFIIFIACNKDSNKGKKINYCIKFHKQNASFVYYGFSNRISITVDNYKQDDIIVEMKHAQVKYSGGCNYKIFTIRDTNESVLDTIKVFVKQDGKTIFVGKRLVQFINLPPPTQILLGHRSSRHISKSTLLKYEGLKPSFGEYSIFFNFEYKTEIQSFILSTTINGIVVEEKSESNRITKKQKEIISKLNVGDKLYFEDFVIYTPSGKKRLLSVIKFVIKE